jgi:hypothetical protein
MNSPGSATVLDNVDHNAPLPAEQQSQYGPQRQRITGAGLPRRHFDRRADDLDGVGLVVTEIRRAQVRSGMAIDRDVSLREEFPANTLRASRVGSFRT